MGVFDWLFSKNQLDSRDRELIALTIRENLESGNYNIVQGLFNKDTETILELEECQKNYLDNAISIISTPEEKSFDVFLAHNSIDKSSVKFIARKLTKKGLKPWLDEEQIQPGTFFQDAIQQAINQVKSVAIFIGPSGFGKWQLMELRSFISVLVEKGIPVIPVLLPGRNEIPSDLLFLKELNWVNFSNDLDDDEVFRKLIWGITGRY
ncbi:hypothetical protein BZZ01_01690 [Nostocales cyanobacterium HT-58-2]|nr:hypothetical protein BZZ01_01690 [Nostocales cyanobacterium HT-58-2]